MTQTTRHRVTVAVASVLLATMAYPAAVGAIPRAQSMRSPHTATRTWCPSVIVARWSLDRLIEQLIVIPVDQAALPEARAEVAAGVGGMILTGTPPANLKQQIASALKVAPDGIFPFVMTDEEGGAVQRLWPLIGDVPSARTMGATMTSGAIERRAAGLALSMKMSHRW